MPIKIIIKKKSNTFSKIKPMPPMFMTAFASA